MSLLRLSRVVILHALVFFSSLHALTQLEASCLSDRVIHVGNLDWMVTKESIIHTLNEVLVTTCAVRITIKELPDPPKPRDQGKFHAGSATVAFNSVAEAQHGMIILQQYSNTSQSALKLRWAPTFDSFSKRKPLVPAILSPKQLELRRLRADHYARRRERVAHATDQVLQMVWEQHPLHTPPVLDAPALDWSQCPSAADPVRGGKLLGTPRGFRKQAAVEAFLFVLREVLLDYSSADKDKSLIADLGCGTGNLILPLAWWLQRQGNDRQQQYQMVGVDINSNSLDRLAQRAKSLNLNVQTLQHDLNLMVDDQQKSLGHFSAVVSLHACGAASDLAIAAAVSHSLPFAISPCCIGKIKRAVRSDQAEDEEERRANETVGVNHLSYPRSKWLREILGNGQSSRENTLGENSHRGITSEFELLASAADYGVDMTDYAIITNQDGEVSGAELARRQRCRKAKLIVETDRLQWAAECGDYVVKLVELPRVGPLYPKRELLLGAKRGSHAAGRISRLYDR